MKSLNRWLAGGLTLLLALGLSLGTAHADTKKKKKKEVAKKEVKVVHHKQVDTATVVGVNNVGRPGYFFSDTAFTPAEHQFTAAAGVQFYSLGSQLSIPFGGSFGITPNIQVHASENFAFTSGGSQLGNIVFGGKYRFDISNKNLSVAGGLDLSDGPLTNTPYTTFNFDPYGIVTYSFEDGLQLNGQLGIYVPGGYTPSVTVGGVKYTGVGYTPPAFVQLNAGASYPVADKLTGIAELDINGAGNGVTPMIVGIRTHADNIQLQAFGGLDLAGTVGILLGGSAAIVTQ